MIKFFRLIRQRLLSENRITKYLIYALGEILLVVIGILIALQINNWNQKRIDSSKETVYLTNLQQELAENTARNKGLITDRMDAKIEALELAKRYCENDLEITDTLEILNKITYGGVFSGGLPLGTRFYYDELLSTGGLQLIKSDSIKDETAEYYARIQYFSERSKSFATDFANYTSGLRPFNRENVSHISKYDQLEMLEEFRSEELRRLVDAEISYAYAIYGYAKTIEMRAEGISELIDKELRVEH